MWDYLIVTASNDRQAEAYRSQLDLRQAAGLIPQAKNVQVVADPGGKRIGSGGSTICCIMRVLERELGSKPDGELADPKIWRAALDRLRILIIHAGGDSKRLPAYGPCGKIFIPIPGKDGAGVERSFPTTIFDRLAPVYLNLPAPRSGNGHVVMTTGDVLLFFDPGRADFSRNGITALGSFAAPEVSKNHGVFIADRTGTIRRYLQKPSLADQKAARAISSCGKSILDIGVMSLDAESAAKLLLMCGVGLERSSAPSRLFWSGAIAEIMEAKGLDFFREISCALGADTEFDDYLRAARSAGSKWDVPRLRHIFKAIHKIPFSLSVVPRCRFLHFGTSRELVRSGNTLRRRDGQAVSGDTIISLNNSIWTEGDPAARENLAPRLLFKRDIIGEILDPARPESQGTSLRGGSGPPGKARGPVRRGITTDSTSGNAGIKESPRIIGRKAWVEGCRIGSILSLEGENIVVGLDVDSSLHFPPKAAMDVLKGKNRERKAVWFVRCYGIDDVFHKAASDGGRLAGLSLHEWLKSAGAESKDIWNPEIPSSERLVWNGRFFPAVRRAKDYRLWFWMLDPGKATSAQQRRWRAVDRYSFEEMAVLADQGAFHNRRLQIRRNI